MLIRRPDCDVVVIGGGPAGAAAAAYLSRAGLDCVLLERELFPRPHVGESLVPAATRVSRELDLLEPLDVAGFPRKYGAVWTSSSDSPVYSHDWEGLDVDSQVAMRFDERQQPGVERNYTYHVDRGKFDLILLQHAHRSGARVYEGVRADRVDFSDDVFPKVHFSIARKKTWIRARMVVDASGRRTLLGNQLRLKLRDPVFDQYALHTWFEGYDRRLLSRSEGIEDYIFVHFLPLSNSWIWQIPITGSVTSIGVVTQKKHFAKSRQSRERFFWKCIETRPDLAEGLVIQGVDDSKRLREKERERLAPVISERALGVGIGLADVDEIDQLNVYQAALLSMRRAIENLPLLPEHILVDARSIPGLDIPQSALKKGDQVSFSIAAASIVAKTHRDALMRKLDRRHPEYGFDRHKGYGTPEHQKAIRQHGLLPMHRKSFLFLEEVRGEYSPLFYQLKTELGGVGSEDGLESLEKELLSCRASLESQETRKLRILLGRRRQQFRGRDGTG